MKIRTFSAKYVYTLDKEVNDFFKGNPNIKIISVTQSQSANRHSDDLAANINLVIIYIE